MRVILQPCGSDEAYRHYEDTILRPVSIARILASVPSDEVAGLSETFAGREAIPTWGVVPGQDGGNVVKWERIRTGDLALFSRQKRIFAASFVAAKAHSADLARALWSVDDRGQTWEYLYFLDELNSLDIPYSEFNHAAGYKENNVIYGFNVLSEEISNRIAERLELFSERYQPPIAEQDISAELEAVEASLGDLSETDVSRVAAARKEQHLLRRILFGGRVKAECCICGDEFPIDLLVASHVKRRVDCSEEERRDKNVIAPMCKVGCDALYEGGYIVVDESGIIRTARTPLTTPDLNAVLRKIAGRRCAAWSVERSPYFEWHRARYAGPAEARSSSRVHGPG